MARPSGVRVKNGSWYSEAGGVGRYFGRADEITRDQAMDLLRAALRGEAPAEAPATVDELRDRFLEWVAARRADKTRVERALHLRRFVEHFGGRRPDSITSADVERWTAWLFGRKYAADYVAKHLMSVKVMYNRAARLGWIPRVDPFARVEPLRLPRKPLLESDLPTLAEVEALVEAGDRYGDMGDLLRLYHATGARTHELVQATAGDFQRAAGTIVLGRHKRAHTLRDPIPRTLVLNPASVAILERLCGGRPHGDPIFTRPTGGPYSNVNVAERFQSVRRRAMVRAEITIYSLRHLWISEALMAGVDGMLVARMAGTSVKMIETVYGHFRVASMQDAQARLDAARAGRSGDKT
jgi:integrase